MSSKLSKVLVVADYFIYKSNQANKKDLTNKKLQKLLYYAQAWSVALSNKRLFKENIEAWIHGPAIPSVYKTYKNYGFLPIVKDVDPSEFADFNAKEKKLLDSIWQIYGKYDASYLEQLTHNEEPWISARKGMAPFESSNNIISLQNMREYYLKKLSDTKKGR